MKGVLLCGGEGTRLRPMTLAVNKHMIRVGRKPMIEYPLRKLIQAGITNIHVVTGGENYPGLIKYLGSGSAWNVRITYSIQDKAGGIAEALGLAEPFIDGDKMIVVLGDNIFNMNLSRAVKEFAISDKAREAWLFTCLSDTPERFGVLSFKNNDPAHWDPTPIDILEKPAIPPSKWIVTGIYMYTGDVFEKIRTITPSQRGELEITDVNRRYIQAGQSTIIKMEGYWTDCGTLDTLTKAEDHVKGEL